MKLLAFGASTSKHSINKKLPTYGVSLVNNADTRVIDLNDFEMPIYSVDYENENGIPKEAHRFLQHITEADFIIISLAEHNGSYSAAFISIDFFA